jgi:hypothetical protein
MYLFSLYRPFIIGFLLIILIKFRHDMSSVDRDHLKAVVSRSVAAAFLAVVLFVFFTSPPSRKGSVLAYPVRVDMLSFSVRYPEKGDVLSYYFIPEASVPLMPDVRGELRPVTEYMKKYHPFTVRNPMMAWKWVVDHVEYADDFSRFGKKDAWQFAEYTFSAEKGDCEDASILLCDWLRAEGHDARVALGELGCLGGHAWVILQTPGGAYLMESTSRKASRSGKFVKLLRQYGKMINLYKPEALFNESVYWKRRNDAKEEEKTWNGNT